MSGPRRGRPGFATTVITPWGTETYQVLLWQDGPVWLATIVTLPNRVWAKPGGREALKFHGKTAEEAESAAVEFIEAERIVTNRRLWTPGTESAPKIGSSRSVGHAISGSTSSVASSPPPRPADRYPARLLLRFGKDGPQLPGLTANLSESGLFVITDSPSPIGGHVQIDLRFPDQPVFLWGEVVWVSQRKVGGRSVGFGARLLQRPLEYTARIRKLQTKSP